MSDPKILIGCPTSFHKEYSLEEYTKAIKQLTYPNFDILLVDNSKDNNYKKKIESYNIPVIKGPWFESARDRIVASRNILRQKALDEGYDYFFSLEQDVLPPPDILENFLEHKKRIITAIYFNTLTKGKETRFLPLIWTKIDKDLRYILKPSELNKGLKQIAISGLGCILIHKTILSKVKFRYEPKESAFDDVYFSLDCKKNKFSFYVDTNIVCKHLIKNRPWDWNDIKN